jgi:hypothetical protein
MLDKVTAAWGTEMPAWVRTLAAACHGASLRKTASKLGVSPAIVSLAINNKRRDLDFIKSRVEQHLMTVQVGCPVFGVISGNRCLEKQAAPFSAANPLGIQLYRACRNGCPNFRAGGAAPGPPAQGVHPLGNPSKRRGK